MSAFARVGCEPEVPGGRRLVAKADGVGLGGAAKRRDRLNPAFTGGAPAAVAFNQPAAAAPVWASSPQTV
jgi:hypothetical protein